MDTPGGTLAAEFSPMGPVLHNPFTSGFGDEPTPTKLSLSRDNSEDLGDEGEPTPVINSPFSGFINDFNHFPPPPQASATADRGGGGLQGVPRSPLRSERRAAASSTISASDPRSDRPSLQPLTSTQPDNRRPRATPAVMASPLEQSSGAKPRKLWQGLGVPSTRPMRLEVRLMFLVAVNVGDDVGISRRRENTYPFFALASQTSLTVVLSLCLHSWVSLDLNKSLWKASTA
jgi:hypothetical protein